MNRCSFILLAIMMICSTCKSQPRDIGQANEYNNIGTKLLIEYNSNQDSLRKAANYFDKAIQNNDTLYAAYTNKLAVLLALGECDKATSYIDKILNLRKGDEGLIVMKANLLERQGRMDKANRLYIVALEDYNEKIAKYPNENSLKVNRVFVQLFIEGKDEAMKKYYQLKREYPHDMSILCMEDTFIEFDRDEYIKSICNNFKIKVN